MEAVYHSGYNYADGWRSPLAQNSARMKSSRNWTAAETMTAILKEDPPELTEMNRGISATVRRHPLS